MKEYLKVTQGLFSLDFMINLILQFIKEGNFVFIKQRVGSFQNFNFEFPIDFTNTIFNWLLTEDHF